MEIGFICVALSLAYLVLQWIFHQKLRKALCPATRYYRGTEVTVLGSPEENFKRARNKLALKMKRAIAKEVSEESLMEARRTIARQRRGKRNDFLLLNGGVVRIRRILEGTLVLSSMSMTIGLVLIIISI